MTNENLTTEVITRLKQFMEQIGVSVTQFADNTGIQRSSMSQILGGRNQKISIITIGKIHDAYPHLSLTWLLSGEGAMLTNDQEATGTYSQQEESVSLTAEESGGLFLSLFDNEDAINMAERPSAEKYATENGLKTAVGKAHSVEKEDIMVDQAPNIPAQKVELKNKRIEKIMIFYSDSTFEVFSSDRLK